MSFASEMAKMADEMLIEFGSPREMVFIKETATGTESAPGTPIETEYIVSAVEILKFLDSAEQGTMVDERKRRIVMSTTLANGDEVTVPPVSGDKMEYDGNRWSIDSVAGVSPGGEVIVYKLDVSR